MRLEDYLDEKLVDDEFAIEFLNAILEETPPDELPEAFRIAVIQVARARGISKVAEEAGVHRQTFYKTGALTFSKLSRILTVLGLELRIQSKEPAKAKTGT